MSSRRESAGKPGIFYRLDDDGKRVPGVFEFWYIDSDGKRRWQTVHGKLSEAVAGREDKHARKRKGERVAPSKLTLGEFAETWIEAQRGRIRPRTVDAYTTALRCHIVPRLGRHRLTSITVDDVADLIADMKAKGYAAWTIHGTLTPLGRMFGNAARRGLIAGNPVRALERGERPSPGRTERRVLSRAEIERLLGLADDSFRPLVAAALFTGLRIGELLGLTWNDVRFDEGGIVVRRQMGRDRVHVDAKTGDSIRSVVLMPALAAILREHRLRSAYSADGDLVFPSEKGTPQDQRNVGRRLQRLRDAAGLGASDGRPPFRWHDSRHTFVSLLIAQGADVVTVSRQAGHADPSITARIYSHEFEAARQRERTTALLEEGFGSLLMEHAVEHGAGKTRQEAASSPEAEVVDMQGFRG